MSTEAPAAPAAPATPAAGTPGSDPTPLNVSAKSLIADAFKTKAADPAPASPTPPESKESIPAQPATKKDSILKQKSEPAKPADPVATPEELPEDKLQIPANASPEAVKNFKAYKDSMKQILSTVRQELSDTQSRLKVHQSASPADAAKYQAMEAENKAMRDRLAVLDLQSHPDFAKQYTEPKRRELATVSEVLGYNGKEGVELSPLLSKSMKDFNAAASELIKDMNAADAGTVMQSLRRARELHNGESQAIAQSSQLAEQLKSKSAQQQRTAFDEAASEVGDVFATREIAEGMSDEDKASTLAYNQSVAGMRAKAESRAFGSITPRQVADMAFKEAAFDHVVAHALPLLERTLDQRNQVIADLRSQLEAIRGARSSTVTPSDPKQGGGQSPSINSLVRDAFKGRL
jgi:hypothetical protein